MLGGLSAQDWVGLAGTGLGTAGALMQDTPNITPTSQTNDPNMQRLIASLQGRLDQSEPLFKSIMSMANGLLPTQYQRGG